MIGNCGKAVHNYILIYSLPQPHSAARSRLRVSYLQPAASNIPPMPSSSSSSEDEEHGSIWKDAQAARPQMGMHASSKGSSFAAAPVAPVEHVTYAEGPVVVPFVNEVQQSMLSWSLEDLAENNHVRELSPMLSEFQSIRLYCQTVAELALEEFRCQLGQSWQRMSHARAYEVEAVDFIKATTGDEFDYLEFGFDRIVQDWLQHDVIVLELDSFDRKSPPATMLGLMQRTGHRGMGRAKMCLAPTNPHARLFRDRFTPSCRVRVRVIDSAVSMLRQFEALEYLGTSHLREFVKGASPTLPTIAGRTLGFSQQVLQRHTRNLQRELNPSQVDAVRVALDVQRPMAMIHGPPGSGKTKTLMALLRMYFAIPSGSDLLSSATGTDNGTAYRAAVANTRLKDV